MINDDQVVIKDRFNNYCITFVNKEIAGVIREEFDQLLIILKLTDKYYHITPNLYDLHNCYNFNVAFGVGFDSKRIFKLYFDTNRHNLVDGIGFLDFTTYRLDRYIYAPIHNPYFLKEKELYEIFEKAKRLALGGEEDDSTTN